MTPEQIKSHRRAIFDALIEGRQCQVRLRDGWLDQPPWTVAANLFNPGFDVRIKPEPRKCWVRWGGGGAIGLANVQPADDGSWQEVPEEVK